MIITVDLGNSAVKIGVFENGNLLIKRTFEIDGLEKIDFTEITNGRIRGAIFSSVVPEKDEIIFRKLSSITESVIKLSHANARVPIGYRDPAQLGADRIAHAYFVKSYVREDTIVVDIGTALTIDTILGDGTHLGGAILASPGTVLEALTMKASRLKRIDLKVWPEGFIGKSTEECLKIGLLQGSVGAVFHIVENIQYETGRRFKKYLTGRGGKFFEEKLEDFRYNPDLNLYGLFAAYNDIKRR